MLGWRSKSQFHEPYVSLELTDIGGKLFEQITGANVKKRLAIILDNSVYSAPVIQERIGGGRAQITGRFDTKEASDLAIVLRSGALPAPLRSLNSGRWGLLSDRIRFTRGCLNADQCDPDCPFYDSLLQGSRGDCRYRSRFEYCS